MSRRRMPVAALAGAGLLACAVSQAGAGCSGPPAEALGAQALPVHGEPGVLPGISVDGRLLDARALAAEAAFHFPDETRALVRGLLRARFAQLEAERLGILPDEAELERAFEDTLANIRGQLEEGEEFEDWARRRYGRNGGEVEAALRDRLRTNQLYQLVLRADAHAAGRVVIQMLVARDEETAAVWARRLSAGADPGRMARESLDPGPQGDASYPPLPAYLPAPLGAALAAAEPAAVVGPFRFEGDQAWRVVRLVEKLPPSGQVPPVAELVESLTRDPVSGVEARAWFEEMVRRYTAEERLPGIQTPTSAFVSAGRP